MIFVEQSSQLRISQRAGFRSEGCLFGIRRWYPVIGRGRFVFSFEARSYLYVYCIVLCGAVLYVLYCIVCDAM